MPSYSILDLNNIHIDDSMLRRYLTVKAVCVSPTGLHWKRLQPIGSQLTKSQSKSAYIYFQLHMAEDIEVTHADQQRINSFATWNLKFKGFLSEYENYKKELANINDAEDEMIVLDENTHPYAIGDTFFHLSSDEIGEELTATKEKVKVRMLDLEERITPHIVVHGVSASR
uniref:Uncharacterized protein n=1 Tax=Trichobilharzia regenti TaxID=157069 RepID=A0AA85KKJ3_TRIRE|nr:unnamed protein product [Trichobilharzia regenti]